MKYVLLLLVGAVVWTGRGLFLQAQQGTKQPPKMSIAQVERVLPEQQGWAGTVKNVRCTDTQQSLYDYVCTFTAYGTVAKARTDRGGRVFKVGVEALNGGHTVIGQVVRLDSPLGPAPPR